MEDPVVLTPMEATCRNPECQDFDQSAGGIVYDGSEADVPRLRCTTCGRRFVARPQILLGLRRDADGLLPRVVHDYCFATPVRLIARRYTISTARVQRFLARGSQFPAECRQMLREMGLPKDVVERCMWTLESGRRHEPPSDQASNDATSSGE